MKETERIWALYQKEVKKFETIVLYLFYQDNTALKTWQKTPFPLSEKK